MCILKLNNVSKTFNNFYLDNINFELPKGYIIGYIGPNGSGKTTTIKLITDQYLPDSGTIYINGKSFLIQKRIIETQSVILLMIFIFQISLKSIQ